MIYTPVIWQTRILDSPRILQLVKIQHAHGQKMIDSPCSMTDQDLT